MSAGGCHAGSVRAGGLSVSRMIAATCRAGMGRTPVHQPDTFCCGTPSSPASRCPATPDREMRERNSAGVIAAAFTSNSFTSSGSKRLPEGPSSYARCQRADRRLAGSGVHQLSASLAGACPPWLPSIGFDAVPPRAGSAVPQTGIATRCGPACAPRMRAFRSMRTAAGDMLASIARCARQHK